MEQVVAEPEVLAGVADGHDEVEGDGGVVGGLQPAAVGAGPGLDLVEHLAHARFPPRLGHRVLGEEERQEGQFGIDEGRHVRVGREAEARRPVLLAGQLVAEEEHAGAEHLALPRTQVRHRQVNERRKVLCRATRHPVVGRDAHARPRDVAQDVLGAGEALAQDHAAEMALGGPRDAEEGGRGERVLGRQALGPGTLVGRHAHVPEALGVLDGLRALRPFSGGRELLEERHVPLHGLLEPRAVALRDGEEGVRLRRRLVGQHVVFHLVERRFGVLDLPAGRVRGADGGVRPYSLVGRALCQRQAPGANAFAQGQAKGGLALLRDAEGEGRGPVCLAVRGVPLQRVAGEDAHRPFLLRVPQLQPGAHVVLPPLNPGGEGGGLLAAGGQGIGLRDAQSRASPGVPGPIVVPHARRQPDALGQVEFERRALAREVEALAPQHLGLVAHDAEPGLVGALLELVAVADLGEGPPALDPRLQRAKLPRAMEPSRPDPAALALPLAALEAQERGRRVLLGQRLLRATRNADSDLSSADLPSAVNLADRHRPHQVLRGGHGLQP